MTNKKGDDILTEAVDKLKNTDTQAIKQLLNEGIKSEQSARDNWLKVLNAYSSTQLEVDDVRNSVYNPLYHRRKMLANESMQNRHIYSGVVCLGFFMFKRARFSMAINPLTIHYFFVPEFYSVFF